MAESRGEPLGLANDPRLMRSKIGMRAQLTLKARPWVDVRASRLDRQTKFASSSERSATQQENISNPKGSPLH